MWSVLKRAAGELVVVERWEGKPNSEELNQSLMLPIAQCIALRTFGSTKHNGVEYFLNPTK